MTDFVRATAELPCEIDCLVVGGGPAGLTAAIYLSRFHLAVAVVDAGASRAALIPLTRNHAGFPDGISGQDLLSRMRQQARKFGVSIEQGCVESVSRVSGGFTARVGDRSLRARSLLLATGVVNRRPAMLGDAAHAEALADGRLRYCPICDGYEATDQRIAVLGTGERGSREALFLRSFSADVTLVGPEAGHELSDAQRQDLHDAGVVLGGRCTAIGLPEGAIELEVDGRPVRFDCLYPALGSDICSALAAEVGAAVTAEGCLVVDPHQRTDVPGLYAAGDVVLGLDQISHAMGEGGVAATTIRNDLARQAPLLR